MNYISKVQVSDNTVYDIKDSISRQKILSQKYYEDPDIVPTSQDDFTFSISNNVASVTGYTGSGGGIVIPYEYESNGNSYKVTSIGDLAFEECNNITSIIIPHSVTNIGSSVFLNCSGITSMTIPDSVTSIGTGAFESCSGLISITIPNSVTNMSSYVFMDCSSITSVTLPNSITAIGKNTFSICSSLTNVAIPDSVTNIGGRAFADCYYLTSITIPDSVTSIGSNVFENCSSNLVIRCYKGSTADTYAQTNNIPVEYLDVKDNIIVDRSVTNAKLSTDVQNAIAAGNYFGICTDAETTMNKIVTIPNLPTPIPNGTSIRVKFTNAVKNTINGQQFLKLNINNTGNKYVYCMNNDYVMSFPNNTIISSNGILNFTYDASEDIEDTIGVWRLEQGYASDANWADEAGVANHVVDGIIERKSLNSDLIKRVPYFGVCTTAANVNAKRVTISGFPTTLSDGMTVSIMFQNGLYGTYVNSNSTDATIDFSANGTQPKIILVNGIDGTLVCESTEAIIDQGGIVTMTYRASDDVWVMNGKEWVERAVYADFIKDGNVIRNSLDSELGAKADLIEIVENNNNTTTAQINPNNTVNDVSVKGNLKILNNLDITSNITGSPTFTGIPKAPTAAAGTNTTQLATTAFVTNAVNNLLGASNAMIFKGTLGTGGTITALPATHEAGWTYKIITAGTYSGQTCEVGDLIICITDGTTANNAHWTVVETNDAGNVSNSTTVASIGAIPIFDNETGTLIKDNKFFSFDILNEYSSNLIYNGVDVVLKVGDNYINSSNRSCNIPAIGISNIISGYNINQTTGIGADVIDNNIVIGSDIKIGGPSQNESELFNNGDYYLQDSLIIGKGLRNIFTYDEQYQRYEHYNKTILGQYNDYTQNAIFQIGNGADNTHRSNVLNLTESGALNINGNITITKSTDSTFHPLKVRDARIDIFKQDAIESQNILGTSAIKILPTSGEVNIPITYKAPQYSNSTLNLGGHSAELKIYTSVENMNSSSQNSGMFLSLNNDGIHFRGGQYIYGQGNDPDLYLYAPDDITLENRDGYIQLEKTNTTTTAHIHTPKVHIEAEDEALIHGPLSNQSIHLDSYGTKLNGPTYIFEPDTNDSTFKGTDGDSGYLSTHSLSNILIDIKNTTMLDILLWNNTETSSLSGSTILNSSSSNQINIPFEDLSKEQFNSLQLNENGTGEINVLYVGETLNASLLNKIKSFGWYCVGVSKWDGNYDSSLNEISVTSISNNSLITFGIISTKDENDEYWQYVEDPNRKIFIKNIQPYFNYINNTQQNLQRKTEADFVDTWNSDIYVPQNLKILNEFGGVSQDLELAFQDTGNTLKDVVYNSLSYRQVSAQQTEVWIETYNNMNEVYTYPTEITEEDSITVGEFIGEGQSSIAFKTGNTAPEVGFSIEDVASATFFKGDHCMNNMFYPQTHTYYILNCISRNFGTTQQPNTKLFVSVDAYPSDSTVANGAITY